MAVDEPGQIEETILCDLKHSSVPVYVFVKATFEVSIHEASSRKKEKFVNYDILIILVQASFVCKRYLT